MYGGALSPVFVMLCRAELALAQKNYSAVIQIMDELLNHLERTETRVFVYDALFLKAKGLSGQGQADAAYEAL